MITNKQNTMEIGRAMEDIQSDLEPQHLQRTLTGLTSYYIIALSL